VATYDDTIQDPARDGDRVAQVTDQVRDAREEVFRAYVRAREKAHELVGEGGDATARVPRARRRS
jgi:hypothetical protein